MHPVCGLPNLAFSFKLNYLHVSNTRYILAEMSLVERNGIEVLW